MRSMPLTKVCGYPKMSCPCVFLTLLYLGYKILILFSSFVTSLEALYGVGFLSSFSTSYEFLLKFHFINM